jgi:site-specific recombinase XerD
MEGSMINDDDGPAGPNGSEPVGEYVRIYRRGKVWYANYQAGGRQHRVSLKTSSKKRARAKAEKIDTELMNGRWKPATEIWTVEQAVDAYMAYQKAEDRAPKTLTKYAKVLERLKELAAARGVRDLAGVDHTFMDAYKQMRAEEGAQVRTRYTEVVIIRQLVKFAVVRKRLTEDPLAGLKLQKPRPTKQPCWTRDQVHGILKASPPDVRQALTLLAETGMRFGELQWLTWADVDLDGGVLHIRPKDGWRLKTGDERSVPISPMAREVLMTLPRRWRWVVTMPPSAGMPQAGRQWTERRLLTALKEVLAKFGLVGKLHTFRHAFISHALLIPTAVAVVKKWVGHVDPRVIDLYTHVHDGASKDAMERRSDADAGLPAAKDGPSSGDTGSAQTQHTDKEVRDE